MDKTKLGMLALAGLISTSALASGMGPSAVPVGIDSWTGLYLGGQLGEAFGYQILRQETQAATRLGHARTHNSSFLGGGYVGLNWQVGEFLVGVEGDANALNLSNYETCLLQNSGVGNAAPGTCFRAAYNYTIQSPWQAAARARVGWIWRKTLFYVAGGAAFTELKSTFTTAANYLPLGSELYRANTTGTTAGVGGEFKFNGHWIVRAEYRYNNFGTTRHLVTSGGGFWNGLVADEYIQDNSFRMGISYLI